MIALEQLKISEIVTLFQPIKLQIFCVLTIERIMYHIKRISPRRTSVDYYKVIYAVQWFLALDFFVLQSLKMCQVFLICVIFRSWSFSKKCSGLKDLSNDL